jgi:hypothetical protein
MSARAHTLTDQQRKRARHARARTNSNSGWQRSLSRSKAACSGLLARANSALERARSSAGEPVHARCNGSSARDDGARSSSRACRSTRQPLPGRREPRATARTAQGETPQAALAEKAHPFRPVGPERHASTQNQALTDRPTPRKVREPSPWDPLLATPCPRQAGAHAAPPGPWQRSSSPGRSSLRLSRRVQRWSPRVQSWVPGRAKAGKTRARPGSPVTQAQAWGDSASVHSSVDGGASALASEPYAGGRGGASPRGVWPTSRRLPMLAPSWARASRRLPAHAPRIMRGRSPSRCVRAPLEEAAAA